jgi:hypothetical protein
MWHHNIRLVIIPSFLAFAFLGPSIYLDSIADLDLSLLVMWIATSGSVYIGQPTLGETEWGIILALTGLTASMTVNALTTGLIVFRIFKVFRGVKSATTSDEKNLGVTGGKTLRSVIFIIIESGMALFAIQLARLVLLSLEPLTIAETDTYEFIVTIHEMLNVIIRSIIVTYTLLMT